MCATYTGDWAQRENGHVYFKERMEFQIKVRSYRIELDEVAGAIRDCGWPVVCVSKHGDGIAAVVESQAGVKLDEISLLRSLEKKLEHYAIPGRRILEIARMPRNENDKLDRKAVAAWLESQLQSD